MPARLVAGLAAMAMAVVPAVETHDDPRRAQGPTEVAYPEVEPEPMVDTGAAAGEEEQEGDDRGPTVPAPRVTVVQTVSIAVGLSPEAPGSKSELATLDRLERSVLASEAPRATVRRLRPGAGEARLVCRERRDDLVILLGYLPDAESLVVLPHDCRLDRPLGVRALDAVDEPALVAALWNERQELVRRGAKERVRVVELGPKARAGIIAGVALVLVGVAAGFLVANALRPETVVLRVEP